MPWRGADEEWSLSEGVVVETWDDGLGKGEWYVEVEDWENNRGGGKKRKSKAMYALASALLFKTKEEADAYPRSAGSGNWEDGDNTDDGDDGDNGDEGGDGHGDNCGDGGVPPTPNPPSRDTEPDSAPPRGRAGAVSRARAGSTAGARAPVRPPSTQDYP